MAIDPQTGKHDWSYVSSIIQAKNDEASREQLELGNLQRVVPLLLIAMQSLMGSASLATYMSAVQVYIENNARMLFLAKKYQD